MILVWSREQSQRVCTHRGAVGRRMSQWTADFSRNSRTYIVYNSCDLQQFLFFVNHDYAHISLLCFSLVMLSASHWLLAQARFYGRTHLPLSPNSTMPTVRWFSDIFDRMHLFSTSQLWAWWHFGNHLVDIILERIWSCQHPLIHSTCGHDDISVITPVLSIYLSTTSAVFTPAGHVNSIS